MSTRAVSLVRSLALAPFELAFGWLIVWLGVSGLFDWTPQAVLFSNELPHWLASMANLLYTLAGVAIVAGHMRHLREIEAAGLVLAISSLVTHAGMMFFASGPSASTNNLAAEAVVLIIAASIRLWVVLSGRAVVLMEPPRGESGLPIVGKVL